MGVLDTPITFCESLALFPNEPQAAFFERLASHPEVLEVENDPDGYMLKAVALAAVWRLLCRGAALGTILAPNEQVSNEFMGWIYQLTQHKSLGLGLVTSMPRWNQLQVSGYDDWQLRVMPLNVAWVLERAAKSDFGIILNARDEEPEFFEACQALENGLKKPGTTLIRVW